MRSALKASLSRLLHGYLAGDITRALAEICEDWARKSKNDGTEHKTVMYMRWAVSFREAMKIQDADQTPWEAIEQRFERKL